MRFEDTPMIRRSLAKIGARCAAIAALLVLAAPLSAQTISDEQAALRAAQREAAAAIARSRRFDAEAARATDKADQARAAAAATAARIQESESGIAAAEARIAIIERLRARHRRALAAKQQPIARLMAALETMARRPAALTLVQPGSITDMIHTRLLLASILPAIAERTAGLRAEIARGNALRAEAQRAVDALHRHQDLLVERRVALARLEAAQRLRSRKLGDSAFLEQERAQGMGEKARDIMDLMQEMDAQAIASARLAGLSGPLPRPARPGAMRSPPTEKAAGAEPRPAYRLPVIGRVVTGLGEVSDSGVRSRGLSFAARKGAQVIAPAGGRIRYAAPFRGYGTIAILDHGSGWTTLITGLDRIDVAVGDMVVQGSPLGRATGGKTHLTVELRHKGEAIAIAPLAAGM